MLKINMTYFIFAVLAPLLFVSCATKKVNETHFKTSFSMADSNYDKCTNCQVTLPECKKEKIEL